MLQKFVGDVHSQWNHEKQDEIFPKVAFESFNIAIHYRNKRAIYSRCQIAGMKGLFVITLLFVSVLLMGQQPHTGGGYIESKSEKNFRFNMTNALKRDWNINDSLRFIPAYDAYCKWDTENIHAYKLDLAEMTDTTYLQLRKADCDFVHPCPGHVTSDFGPRKGKYHYGIDIKLETGDPVKVVFEGVVRISQYSQSYGHVVVVRHNNGLETLYAHLSRRMVMPGDQVEAGEVIGLGGNTGRSYGSHLHFECRYKGEPINPNLVIDFEKQDLVANHLALSKGTFKYLSEAKAMKYHVVKRGESLSLIASRYGTTVSQLCKLNGIKQTSTLQIGQKVRYR
jgi:murein DD-endopeptidase MepM/ murein hydrolase activator NlpD